MSTSSSTIIEGVGNEVLGMLVFSAIVLVLSLAWYSTYLTPNQTQLTSMRIYRRGVVLNRVPDSSAAESQAGRQAANESERSEQNSATDTADSTTQPERTDDNFNREDSATHTPDPNSNQEHTESGEILPESTSHSDVTENDTDAVRTDNNQNDSEQTPVPQQTDSSAIRIKLKFLTDTERMCTAKKTDTIAGFKRCNFADELANNKVVRLIYNGQVLMDSRTLESYNIVDNTVIHALISEAVQPSTSSPSQEVVFFNAGALMVPLFTVILALIWYLRLEYGQFFNFTSTMSLVCMSIVFIFCIFAQRIPSHNLQANQPRQDGANFHTNDQLR